LGTKSSTNELLKTFNIQIIKSAIINGKNKTWTQFTPLCTILCFKKICKESLEEGRRGREGERKSGRGEKGDVERQKKTPS
jgi:hypothetical protein